MALIFEAPEEATSTSTASPGPSIQWRGSLGEIEMMLPKLGFANPERAYYQWFSARASEAIRSVAWSFKELDDVVERGCVIGDDGRRGGLFVKSERAFRRAAWPLRIYPAFEPSDAVSICSLHRLVFSQFGDDFERGYYIEMTLARLSFLN